MGFWNGKLEEDENEKSGAKKALNENKDSGKSSIEGSNKNQLKPSEKISVAHSPSAHSPSAHSPVHKNSAHETSKPTTEISELSEDLISRYGPLQSALSEGTKVEGNLTFDKPVRIDGELIGEINAPNALVVIGPTGKVDAKIEALFLVIQGEVKGSLHAKEKIELLAGGTINGEIHSPKLVVQDGSIFNGSCHMTQTKATDEKTTKSSETSVKNKQGLNSRKEAQSGTNIVQ